MIHIHDGNIDEYAAAIRSCNFGAVPRASKRGELACAVPYAEVIDLIPESQWMTRYETLIGKFPRQKYYSYNPVHQNQGNHPLCWAFSLIQDIECVRACMGLPYHQLSPESIDGLYNYRDTGGMLDQALAWTANHGVAPRSMVPLYNLSPDTWVKGWERKALDVVPLERFDLGTKDMLAECMTALLSGQPIYFAKNNMAHAMCAMELQKQGNELGIWTPNTWPRFPGDDILFTGKSRIFDEAYVVRQVTFSM